MKTPANPPDLDDVSLSTEAAEADPLDERFGDGDGSISLREVIALSENLRLHPEKNPARLVLWPAKGPERDPQGDPS